MSSDISATAAELRRLREAAKISTLRYEESDGTICVGSGDGYPEDAAVCELWGEDNKKSDDFGKLVVAAVNALPSLLDELDRRGREIKELKTPTYYGDDRNEDAYSDSVDDLVDGDEVGEIIRLRRFRELPTIFVLARDDDLGHPANRVFATREEAEQAAEERSRQP